MKKSIYHIICAWALLFCFVAGQYMVFAHQHHVNKHVHQLSQSDKHNPDKQILKEKCEVCDSMHHDFMELFKPQFALHFSKTDRVYTFKQYHFQSIGLILASGRAPPVIS
ncbi:hypothetical protein FPZ42_04580 [Mucilaginibacter achroorhodeus]|uniref:DUF2946 domain-containing protein n=1 Tax=Mucilaginibacter achroorhodeus TaxID=2599294 RepID=A0A563UAX3_9SPHI|nr:MULTISPECIES: hypothetical protein [Mucilaginibacter]QXV66380.1 hypothetical protein INP83_04660 [Mucilaginibacter sp. 21P]TWR28498.1 hypothetical protein FPZ42_04580 [Mucilaginibacter achroorhodeus]